ncbi:hypothetical protein B0T25DRAFT_634349 [Lasiosphaeria hispida]|uniref:Uncharacterized protein n=1 Tax=Lasiosphaeria hispida TaxID=260671 RepID=A0AAJ0HCI8_9PEZI|nr:hypothetical protein B0T25DRAFT_634349 [Lasiosphaeria hispida]
MPDETRPSTPDNGALIMSAEKQPSSPDRGRRAPSDDREAAPDKEFIVKVSSMTRLEHVLQIYDMASPPYAYPHNMFKGLLKDNEEAWLWHALDDNLFSDPDKWATPQWKAYETLYAFFRHRAGTLDSAITREEHGESGVYAESEFQSWRMITARIMVNTIVAQDTSVRSLAGCLTDRPAVQHTSVDRLADRLMGKLAEIIDEAKKPLSSVANAAAMKGHPFRESRVLKNYDDVFQSEGGPIDFVVSPGIFMSGDTRTRFYEGMWMYPIRVAVGGALDDHGADFRSVMMNLTGS